MKNNHYFVSYRKGLSANVAAFKPAMSVSAGSFVPNSKPQTQAQPQPQQMSQNSIEFKPATTAKGFTPTPSAASTQPAATTQAPGALKATAMSFTPNTSAPAWTPNKPATPVQQNFEQPPAAAPAYQQNQQ